MSILSRAADNPVFVTYVLAFAVAALVCFLSVPRARKITNDDTRRGLVALLLTSGGWATAHVAFLVLPTTTLRIAAYQVGLIVGMSSVGPWLYFCSAFTGRTLHRSPALRRIAVGVFLAIVAVKLTNPIHHLYFGTEFVTAPFPHLAVHNQLLHWVAMGLAYALAAVGYFMLLELLWQIGHDAKPFVALLGLTSLPVVLDVVGLASPLLLDIAHEPLGVAAFAVGLLFVYFEDFQAIQLAGEQDDPVIVLDDENRIRDYNAKAQAVFEDLEIGTVIDSAVPEIVGNLGDDAVIEIERFGGMRYFQMTSNPFRLDETRLGRTITLTDVTDREQYRTELERQNERLEQFASMVSHDLRNPLNVAQGRIEMVRDTHDIEQLEAASNALDRMEALIDDLLALARQGQPIAETQEVRLSSLAEQCWAVVETTEATLSVESDLTFRADADRLQQLLENLFRNAIEHGQADVEIRVGALEDEDGFYVADDGRGIPPGEREQVFESGYSTAHEGTGFGLAIVQEIVDAHGWEITVTESWAGGARFEVTDVAR